MPLEVGFNTLGLWLKDPTLQVHFCLEKNRERLPLGARWSSEAQEAEDPPSFYTSSKVNKNIACRHVSEGIRIQCPDYCLVYTRQLFPPPITKHLLS